MLDADRLRARMTARNISQAELARRVGVSQQNIARLVSGTSIGSRHLHRIARELGTTPAFLERETDDPDENAPPPQPAPLFQYVSLTVALPTENALARMFEGLLELLDEAAPPAERARELARMLPSALQTLKGPLTEGAPARRSARAAAEAVANVDPAPAR